MAWHSALFLAFRCRGLLVADLFGECGDCCQGKWPSDLDVFATTLVSAFFTCSTVCRWLGRRSIDGFGIDRTFRIASFLFAFAA
jgi:hypothetical protein